MAEIRNLSKKHDNTEKKIHNNIAGNALKPLPIDSPESLDELSKKSYRKIFFHRGEKYF